MASASNTADVVEGKSLSDLFQAKYWTASENEVRSATIEQIENVLKWLENRIAELLAHLRKSRSLPAVPNPDKTPEDESLQSKLDSLRDACVARGAVYWKQTRTKLYKGLTRALEEYISTHLETVCGKYGRAREYAEVAAVEFRERETKQSVMPTAEQECKMKQLDAELESLNSEIEVYANEDKIFETNTQKRAQLEADIKGLRKRLNDASKKAKKQQERLAAIRRNADKEVYLDGNVMCVDFLRGTITLRVTLKNKMTPWDWNNKVASYAFEMRDPEIATDDESSLYAMLHKWWNAKVRTSELLHAYSDLRSFKTLLRKLVDLDEGLDNLLSTSRWIFSRLVCGFSVNAEEGKYIVTFLPPRVGADGFRLSFSYKQFLNNDSLDDILVKGLGPLSCDYIPGDTQWKELQEDRALEIINIACQRNLCLRSVVDAFLKYIDNGS